MLNRSSIEVKVTVLLASGRSDADMLVYDLLALADYEVLELPFQTFPLFEFKYVRSN